MSYEVLLLGRRKSTIGHQRLNHRVAMVAFASNMVEICTGGNVKPTPKRRNIGVLSIVIMVPCRQDKGSLYLF